jgi:hypothetical protein
MPEGGAVLAVTEDVLDGVRCRYQCSAAAALPGADTSRFVRMNELA